MDEEEPAWEAELLRAVLRFAPHEDVYAGGWMEVLAPHIKAAEQRGIYAALMEAAEKIRRHNWAARTMGQRCCDDLTDEAADLIDPAKPEST